MHEDDTAKEGCHPRESGGKPDKKLQGIFLAHARSMDA